MGAYLLTAGSTVICAHDGNAAPSQSDARVFVNGAPVVSMAAPWTISACALPPQVGGPCATGQWITGTMRVTSNGQRLVIAGGQSICTPTGTPLEAVSFQARVVAQ